MCEARGRRFFCHLALYHLQFVLLGCSCVPDSMSVPYGELARYVCVYMCVHAYGCVCTMEPQFCIPLVLAEGHSASGLVRSLCGGYAICNTNKIPSTHMYSLKPHNVIMTFLHQHMYS